MVQKARKMGAGPNSSYYRNRQKYLEINEDGQLAISCHPLSYHTKRNDMRKYRQLTFEDRIYMEVCIWQGMTQKRIAEKINCHPSTITREKVRLWAVDHIGRYRADSGQKRNRGELKKRGRKNKLTPELTKQIIEKLNLCWSPEQISGRFKLDKIAEISHETIYKFIKRDRDKGGKLYLKLRHGRRRRKKRFAVPRVRADILARKSIHDRPPEINQRTRAGDWERDLMFGDSRSSALITFIDRKTKFSLIRVVQSKSPTEVARVTIELLSRELCHSITNDNGFEFRNHEEESKTLGIPIYFTNPYSSWEKGTCENLNGLVRQYFQQHYPMKEMTNEKAIEIQNLLNNRPRKGLGYLTPSEVSRLRS